MTADASETHFDRAMPARHDTVLIVDFGSQFTQLIARRVREAGVYCEIVPFQLAEAGFARLRPKAVILSGGPASVAESGTPRAPQAIFDTGVPLLGICYGQMTLAAQLGGAVEGGHHREFGRAEIDIVEDCALFEGLWPKGSRHTVWMSHGDRVTQVPPGFRVVARSANASSFVVSSPASPNAPRFFVGKKLNAPKSPRLPTHRPCCVAPTACAASSMTLSPCFRARALIDSISAA